MTPDEIDRYRSLLRLLVEIELSRRLRVKEDPSDIVQQTMLEAHRDFPAFLGTTEAELYGWLKTILTRNLLNVVRRYQTEMRNMDREQFVADSLEKSSLRIEKLLASEQTSPSQEAMNNERIEQLLDGLAQLLEGERSAILLRYFQDWSLSQISEHLGRPPDAIAGLLKRGLKKLRVLLPPDTE